MTDTELDALEAAAKAATPGPWEADSLNNIRNRDTTIVLTAVLPTHREPRPEDAAFIAAANPAAVLELIAELRQARAERDWLAKMLVENSDCFPPDKAEVTPAGEYYTYCRTHDCEGCMYATIEHWLKAAKGAVK